MFLSTFENRIDKKGRVSVPASFRNILKKESFQGFAAFRSLSHPCVEGFSMTQMKKFSAHVDSFQLFAQDQEDLTASVFADAEALAFDTEGRVMLSEILIAHAELTDKVCFVGRGPTFQLWHPPAFKNYQDLARKRLKARSPFLPLGKNNTSDTQDKAS